MIKSLYIKDFALIDELEVEFGKGLNILTGQTGAGKSIVVGALNMILGERADTELLRQGADKAITEGIIHIGEMPAIRSILQDNSVDYAQDLILRREIRESGSRAFINDTPVTITVLREVGNYLVDLHGQHDHQLLLKEENHRGVIDGFEEIAPLKKAYQNSYNEMGELKRELKKLRKREDELQEKLELYRFQNQELEDADLDPNEEDELEAELKLLDNAEDLDQKAAAIVEMGSGDDINVMELLNQIKLHLEDMARIEEEFESYLAEVSTARISIQEMINFTERYRAGIEFNPQRLEELRNRLSELNRLRKKYNRGIPDLIEYHHEIRKELSLAENFDLEIEKLEKKISMKAQELAEQAKKLHNKRKDIGEKLSSDIVDELTKMGIPNGQFRVRVDWLFYENGWIEIEGRAVECTEHGCDEVSLYISTNKGEEPKPLAKIASGGEISRVMLALKSILAKEQSLPVMIFDEIDNGISGQISEKVGRSMRRLSESCQIIAITHQPQIASQAHHHYKVEKMEKDGRTVSRINPLSNKQHVQEVASLMSGEDITDAALKSAEELIEKNTFRN
ncbi:DNA repair protein RecN [Aliifodinibius sp. S!AR15-10]|uniref:DNA repair protein RecN n=1 Tax=Aliifodinibius sp. S!AR15-10 TaxID=2950437 RepID=UPI002866D70C|nr:DNA repair protein RecN [Aliifodinibius sp. S!AR15-10]MDR8392662.1 DNA repair protein RecN [Aliifodinibius sp. S!AR15-10]